MSTILKALKKLEQEKVTRGESRAEIACDIFKSSPPKRRAMFPGWMVMAGLTVLVAAGAVTLLPGGFGTVTDRPDGETGGPEKTVVVAPPAASQAAAEIDQERVIRQRVQSESVGDSDQPIVEEAALPLKPVVAEEAVAEEATLFVSGIAYQDDSEARLAVVNDLPVMEGTAVDGATVMEIRPDRVLFSRNGETFEVPIDGSF